MGSSGSQREGEELFCLASGGMSIIPALRLCHGLGRRLSVLSLWFPPRISFQYPKKNIFLADVVLRQDEQ